jgi:hypothetical protein
LTPDFLLFLPTSDQDRDGKKVKKVPPDFFFFFLLLLSHMRGAQSLAEEELAMHLCRRRKEGKVERRPLFALSFFSFSSLS